MQSLRRASPGLQFRGFGGKNMRAAGCRIDFELTDLAVMGFVEVVPKLREFFRVADIGSDVFATERPDAVMLVDFPGFNWHIAKRAKQQDIPVYYYLPPQLWAWGGWRIGKMKRHVDHVLCNLPFERDWFEQRGMPATYVGHPFFDEVKHRRLDVQFLAKWQSHDACQVAVLPGSRTREVHKIWPLQLQIIRELAARHPGTRFMVACLKDAHCLWCRSQLASRDDDLNIQFFVNKTSEIIEVADCSLMKSGSVSLEMMARGTPSVVIYQIGHAFYAAGKCLSNLKSITLPNMIAKRTVIPEFLAVGKSTTAAVENAIAATSRLIGDKSARLEQQAELQALTHQFGQTGASDRAAQWLVQNVPQLGAAANLNTARAA